jgi:ATP-dependent DNA helicase RecG
VPGNEWVEDAENRFQSIDIRKPLLLALPQAEASVIDELPRGFRLPEGQMQSVQEPILPRKVIREALANAAMHRNYLMHGPTQIIRFGNRIEVRNVGYSLKAPAQLGQPGSRPRNPNLAAVLHDLHWAEAKGTGIRAMRRLAAEAGLPPPEIHSDRQANEFKLTLFLHHLLTEEDYRWLKALGAEPLSAHEAKALIYARETGAVDNSACRDFCGLDTLAASLVLRRLRDRGLLEKEGSGSRTYYVLAAGPHPSQRAGQPDLPDLVPEPADALPPGMEGCKPTPQGCNPELATLPPELATLLKQQQGRSSQGALRELLVALCCWQPLSGEQLATLLGKDRHYLRNKHLIPMVRAGQLRLRYPESANHPHQAYLAPESNQNPT